MSFTVRTHIYVAHFSPFWRRAVLHGKMMDSSAVCLHFYIKTKTVPLLVAVGAAVVGLGSMPRARHASHGFDEAGVCEAAKPVARSQVRPNYMQ